MNQRRWVLLVFAGAGLISLATSSLRLSAQAPPAATATAPATGGASLHDALVRPFRFPFGKPTTIEEVARHLTRSLGRPVILDQAAMNRLDVRPDDTVQLALEGVRLKTGLRLLLDQLDMTYRIETEDNLLVLTDLRGSRDPSEQVLDELQTLHHDIHELRDLVDEVRTALGIDDGEGGRMRKPTIVEEVPPGTATKPEQDAAKPAPKPRPGRSRPGL